MTGRLEVRGLRRELGGCVLFDGLSFSLEPGERIVLRGPSGSGKTRLLRALAWLDPLDAGEVRLDGRTPREWRIPRWRRLVAYVPQGGPALPGTPAETAEAVRRLRCRADPVDDPVPLAEEMGLPADRWRQPWRDLSGGERQRIHLALALAVRPAVLLLDEPTAALDAEAAARVEAVLRGRTAVWVTHDPAEAGRIGGRVLEVG